MRGNHREWELDAACREYPTEIFFGDTRGWSAENKRAIKYVCGGCPVSRECLEAALAEEQDEPERYGIRGGMTANQRKKYWNELVNRRAGWCGKGLHIMELTEEECPECRREAMKKPA